MINRIYKTEEEGKPVVHIIGKMDSAEMLDKFLSELVSDYNKKNQNTGECSRIIFDLKETELIVEPCLEILKSYSKKYSVRFQNFSLYVELLLNEYGLLQEKIID
jgi:hypothetical protein